ncbi:hypothetical protein F383_06586 [Gossypium arboreum]|uniref:Uncharacterized protein n=1 Tax=Gossypium arboreum TaxID=29729 RepID=A0A0B0PD75_GOSAR|nr:hypothetical protein F383_06586 [Gossypium arboreum]
MSLIMAPITDLSGEVVWDFLIIVLESPMIVADCKPSEIPNFIPSKHACASAANEEEILL